MIEIAEKKEKELGTIVTFYSYKGGVGRSMALASIGVLLALEGKKTLLLDWDLEAPGLESYFGEQNTNGSSSLKYDVSKKDGIIDLLLAAGTTEEFGWRRAVNQIRFSGGSLDFISAGRRDSSYKKRLRELDWGMLYEERDIGGFLDNVRREVKRDYDVVLVDSRTGITDVGDVCTVLLPDILAVLFVSNRQNISGCRDVIERARNARQKLPVNRSKLMIVPLAARDESDSEYAQATAWRLRYADNFGHLLREWLPQSVSVRDYFNRFYIPYVPNWSFGERIPVLESPRELSDPKTIGASFQDVARLLERKLSWYSDELISREEVSYLRNSKQELRIAEDEYRELERVRTEQQIRLQDLEIRLKESEIERAALSSIERRRERLYRTMITGVGGIAASLAFLSTDVIGRVYELLMSFWGSP